MDVESPFSYLFVKNLGKLIQALKGEIRGKVELSTKCGFIFENGDFRIRGDPVYIRAACEASLNRLDVDYIDLYYLHRIDIKVPIEIAVSFTSAIYGSTSLDHYF